MSIRIGTRQPRARIRRGDLEPVDIGQADIEDQRVEAAAGLDELERLTATDSEVDDVAFLGQEPLEEPPQPRVVLDDEHVHVPVLRPVSEGSLKGPSFNAPRVARSTNQRAVGGGVVR